jgi:hypothetical protein
VDILEERCVTYGECDYVVWVTPDGGRSVSLHVARAGSDRLDAAVVSGVEYTSPGGLDRLLRDVYQSAHDHITGETVESSIVEVLIKELET